MRILGGREHFILLGGCSPVQAGHVVTEQRSRALTQSQSAANETEHQSHEWAAHSKCCVNSKVEYGLGLLRGQVLSDSVNDVAHG